MPGFRVKRKQGGAQNTKQHGLLGLCELGRLVDNLSECRPGAAQNPRQQMGAYPCRLVTIPQQTSSLWAITRPEGLEAVMRRVPQLFWAVPFAGTAHFFQVSRNF